MPVRLFSLRNVPDDEADEIRKLLTDNDIEFYETAAGNWNISTPGIWLHEKEQLQEAKAVIDAYQEERAAQQRKIYAQQKCEGNQRTFWAILMDDPLKVIAYIGIIGLILYFSTKLFLSLGH